MAGDDRAVMRTAAVLLLTALAVVALRGYLPGAPPPTASREAGNDGAGSLVAIVAMLVVAISVIALSLIGRSRSATRPPADASPNRVSGARGSVSWRYLVVAAAALLAWLALVLLLMRWLSPVDATGAPVSKTPPDPPAQGAPPPGRAESGGDTVFGLLLGATIALFLLSVIATVAGRKRRGAATTVPDDVAPHRPAPAGPDLARAAEVGLAEIGDRTRDPREAIIACYAAMERELEKSPGTVPQVSDTPSEVLARAVARHALRADSAAQLVDLFEEARFSPHVMTEDHRGDAVRALSLVQRELQGSA